MRLLISSVILACELSSALAEEREPAPPSSHPELHESILSQYRFAAHPMPESALSPVWSTHRTLAEMPPPALGGGAIGPEVVRMPPVIVIGDAAFRKIDLAVRTQDARARIQKSYSRLGIGAHELRLRKVSLYTITVFYVPIAVGISW